MKKRNEDGETSKIHPVRDGMWVENSHTGNIPSRPGRHSTSILFSTHISFLTERAAVGRSIDAVYPRSRAIASRG